MNSIRTKVVSVMTVILLALGLAGVSVVADATIAPQEQISSASATIPQASGSYVCNTTTGKWDLTWVVRGDPNYPNATATIKSQTRSTTPTLIGLTVKDLGTQSGTESVSSTGTYTFQVAVQWSSHATGNLVNSNVASVTITGTCAVVYTPTVTLDGQSACTTQGTWTVNWTVTISNYGTLSEVDLKVIKHLPAGSLINGVDAQVWLYEWIEHNANHGLPAFPPGGIATFTQTGIPGSATSATAGVQFDFKGGPSGDPEKTITLTGPCKAQDATATVVVDTAETCLASSTAKAQMQFATLDAPLDQSVGTHDATFTANTDHLFSNGTDKLVVSYTIKAPDPSLCPKDATAEVVLDQQETCLTSSTAKEATLYATLDAPLDLTVGTHDAPFTAKPGHFFADGTDKLVVSYTIKAPDPSLCPKDATASASVNTVETCDANSTAKLDLVNAILGIPSLPTSVGMHTVPVEAKAGHLFANGTAQDTVTYEIKGKKTGEICERLPVTGVDPFAAVTIAVVLLVSGLMFIIPWTRRRIARLFRWLYYKLIRRTQGAHVLM